MSLVYDRRCVNEGVGLVYLEANHSIARQTGHFIVQLLQLRMQNCLVGVYRLPCTEVTTMTEQLPMRANPADLNNSCIPAYYLVLHIPQIEKQHFHSCFY